MAIPHSPGLPGTKKPWNNFFLSYPTYIPPENLLNPSFKIYLQRWHLIIFTTTTLSHHHCQPKLFLLVIAAQSRLNLWDPMNFAIPSGSSAQEILQARILEWVAISLSRGLNYLNILKTGLLDVILFSLSLTYPNKTIKANPSKRFEACHVTFWSEPFHTPRFAQNKCRSPYSDPEGPPQSHSHTLVSVAHHSHPLALVSHMNFPPTHSTCQACPYHRTSVSTTTQV